MVLEDRVYRIGGFRTKCGDLRRKLVALGFVPGAEISLLHTWFFKRYWLVGVGTQHYGMRLRDLDALKLHLVDDE